MEIFWSNMDLMAVLLYCTLYVCVAFSFRWIVGTGLSTFLGCIAAGNVSMLTVWVSFLILAEGWRPLAVATLGVWVGALAIREVFNNEAC